MGLLGTFDGRMDPQARIVIPQRFREAVESGMVLARGLDKCIEAYPPLEWEQLANRVKQFSPFDPNSRLLRRLTFSGAFNASLDRAGRIVLPLYLRQYAGIEEDVILTGEDTFFDIWAPGEWREQEAKAGQLGQIAQGLERPGEGQGRGTESLERGRA